MPVTWSVPQAKKERAVQLKPRVQVVRPELAVHPSPRGEQKRRVAREQPAQLAVARAARSEPVMRAEPRLGCRNRA